MQKFYKNSMQNFDRIYQKLLSQFLYTLLHLSKVVMAVYGLSTNR